MTGADYMTPDEFAKHFGWSPRKVREIARGLGACRIIGNRMVLIQKDIDAILEASRPCPSPYTNAATSTTIGARSTGGGYAEPARQQTGKQPSASPAPKNKRHGKVILMARTPY